MLADRFSLSTLAYQGYGRGLPLDRVRDASTSPRVGWSRTCTWCWIFRSTRARGGSGGGGMADDRIEAAGTAFREAVRDGYLALAESEPGVEVVSARGTPEEVHVRLRNRLMSRFPATFGVQGSTQPVRTG